MDDQGEAELIAQGKDLVWLVERERDSMSRRWIPGRGYECCFNVRYGNERWWSVFTCEQWSKYSPFHRFRYIGQTRSREDARKLVRHYF